MTCAKKCEGCGCAKGAELPVTAMTLRDHFAACALTGMLADPAVGIGADDGALARAAYGFADAMLAARTEGER